MIEPYISRDKCDERGITLLLSCGLLCWQTGRKGAKEILPPAADMMFSGVTVQSSLEGRVPFHKNRGGGEASLGPTAVSLHRVVIVLACLPSAATFALYAVNVPQNGDIGNRHATDC